MAVARPPFFLCQPFARAVFDPSPLRGAPLKQGSNPQCAVFVLGSKGYLSGKSKDER